METGASCQGGGGMRVETVATSEFSGARRRGGEGFHKETLPTICSRSKIRWGSTQQLGTRAPCQCHWGDRGGKGRLTGIVGGMDKGTEKVAAAGWVQGGLTLLGVRAGGIYYHINYYIKFTCY